MALYLMQHGQATTEAENAASPLTEAGRAAVERVAARAKAADVRIDRCVHSGRLRAEQTAEVLVGALGSESIEFRDGLAPNDPVAPVADWLRDAAESSSIALVGHLPFLDRLASLLITDDENTHVVEFRMGGLVKLVPKSEGPRFHGRLESGTRDRVAVLGRRSGSLPTGRRIRRRRSTSAIPAWVAPTCPTGLAFHAVHLVGIRAFPGLRGKGDRQDQSLPTNRRSLLATGVKESKCPNESLVLLVVGWAVSPHRWIFASASAP